MHTTMQPSSSPLTICAPIAMSVCHTADIAAQIYKKCAYPQMAQRLANAGEEYAEVITGERGQHTHARLTVACHMAAMAANTAYTATSCHGPS